MELNQLHYFYTVCKCGSINKAANELYVDRSTISKSIDRLERELNTTFFSRNALGTTLTEEGMLFYQGVEKIFSDIDEIKLSLDKLKENKRIKFRFCSVNSMAREIFLPLLKATGNYIFEYTVLNNSPECINAVKTKDADFAFLLDDRDVGVLEKYLFYVNQLFVKIPINHRLANSNVVTVKDLENEKVRIFMDGNYTKYLIYKLENDYNVNLNVEYIDNPKRYYLEFGGPSHIDIVNAIESVSLENDSKYVFKRLEAPNAYLYHFIVYDKTLAQSLSPVIDFFKDYKKLSLDIRENIKNVLEEQ